jgi:hypothetical protein
MARFLMGALVLCACGKVAEAPDARSADAALDALSCASPMLECAAACVDPTTDTKNCGGCGIQCQSGVESCQAGTCVDTIMTCANVAAGNPSAPDGAYTLVDGTVIDCDFSGETCAQMFGSNGSLPNGTYTKSDGTTIDCDMQDGGLTITGVAWDVYTATPVGYSIISLADFQSAPLQQIFIKYYNAQGGAALIVAFQSSNCCFRYDATGSNTLQFGSDFVYPESTAGVVQCDVVATSFGALEAFSLEGSTAVSELPPLGSDFFTTNVPQGTAACGTPNVSPAFFWKVMQ